MEIRRLRGEDREGWLALLDGWDVGDGWRGRDFFRRPLDHDPGFRDSDVWVAEDGGALLSTVQIFPRVLRLADAEVPTGGIGSVFTREDARGSGIASRLLERCVADMRERAMELSLLFAIRIPFYERLGWRSWGVPRALLRPAGEAPPHGFALAGFEAARDLESVVQLHAEARAGRNGPAARSAAAWRASLRLAGNPGEDFRVARDSGGRLIAYARAILLQGALVVAEHAGSNPAAEAALLRSLLEPLDPDPLARPERSSKELRSFAVLPAPTSAALEAALVGAGVASSAVQDPTVLLCCLDAAALGRRIGEAPRAGERDEDFLRRVLPPERWSYWPSDRF